MRRVLVALVAWLGRTVTDDDDDDDEDDDGLDEYPRALFLHLLLLCFLLFEYPSLG